MTRAVARRPRTFRGGGALWRALALANAAAAARPNILFMLVDDGGFESPVWDRSLPIPTPNIEALAERSTIFDRAYAAVSSCSPSRAAILSGLPTHQNGMYGLHQSPGNFQSALDVVSLPNLLNDNGYVTGILGKHHVGPLGVSTAAPNISRENPVSTATGRDAGGGPRPRRGVPRG